MFSAVVSFFTIVSQHTQQPLPFLPDILVLFILNFIRYDWLTSRLLTHLPTPRREFQGVNMAKRRILNAVKVTGTSHGIV